MFNLTSLILSLILWFLLVLIWICVGRGIAKSWLDYYRSRILLITAIINTVACSILISFQGITGLVKAATSNHFSFFEMLLSLLLFIWPLRTIWNYFAVPRRLRQQFYLVQHSYNDLVRYITTVAKTFEISPPVVLSSHLVSMPFVFGRGLRDVFLAVPRKWQDANDSGRRVILSHELAHIRNGDVGFLTWAFAFLRDIWWFILLIPAFVITCILSKSGFWIQMLILYAVCLVNLWLLFKVVIKARELLADSTVAMMIGSSDVTSIISEQSIPPADSPQLAILLGRVQRAIQTIRNWLWDKACFGKNKSIWIPLLTTFDFFFSSHPSVSQRSRSLDNHDFSKGEFSLKFVESFWSGISVGILGVVVALGGFWFAKFVLGIQNDMEIVNVPYKLFLVVGPVEIGLVALLFVLPAWSSRKTVNPSLRQMVALISRYAVGFAAACFASILILVGGWGNIEIKILLVVTVLWCIFGFSTGLGVNILLMVIWIQGRYLPRGIRTDFKWAMYALGPGIAIVMTGFASGFTIFLYGKVLIGAILILAMLIGVFTYSVGIKDSAVSGTDRYATFVFGPLKYRCEGRSFKVFAPLLESASLVVICCGPAMIVSGIIYLLKNKMTVTIDNFIAIVVLGIVGCCMFLFLGWQWGRRLRKSKCHKIYCLHEGLMLLGENTSAVEDRIITEMVDAYDTGNRKSKNYPYSLVTTELFFELTALSSGMNSSQFAEVALIWLEKCQSNGGFSLWPGSSPRLCSTYQCLFMLRNLNSIARCNSGEHLNWIKSLWQDDGTFKGPWSERPVWEDTFFATASLQMLGEQLNCEQKEKTLSWTQQTLTDIGIKKDKADVVYYCLAIIDALGDTDDKPFGAVDSWLPLKINKLLLSNIAYNCDDVHFAIKTWHIISKIKQSTVQKQKLELLAERMHTTLKAELSGLRL